MVKTDGSPNVNPASTKPVVLDDAVVLKALPSSSPDPISSVMVKQVETALVRKEDCLPLCV